MHDIDGAHLGPEQFEGEGESGELDAPLHESQELELASRLLEVSNEQELEQFLGDVFHAAGNAAGRFARSATGQALRSMLKDAVGKALPGAGAGDLAQQAGSLLGLELEGLSPPDQEFETARQLVRWTGSAYRNAAWAPRNVRPRVAARAAVVSAARRYAPGYIRGIARGGNAYPTAARSGYASAYPYGFSGRQPGYAYSQAYPQYGGYGYGQYGTPPTWHGHRHRRWQQPTPYAGMYPMPPDGGDGYDPGAFAPDVYGDPNAVAGPPAASDPAASSAPPVPAPSPLTAEPGTANELGGGFLGSGGRSRGGGPGNPGARTGQWVRRGRTLTVLGL